MFAELSKKWARAHADRGKVKAIAVAPTHAMVMQDVRCSNHAATTGSPAGSSSCEGKLPDHIEFDSVCARDNDLASRGRKPMIGSAS